MSAVTLQKIALQVQKWERKSVLRVEDKRLVTGRGTFVDDFKVPGMHYACVVRSPYGHAIIRDIDSSEAMKLPGVVGVLTGKDIERISDPFPVGISNPPKYYSLAVDKARYDGEPVAIVVAKERSTAEDAAELVHVEYEVLPAVVDIERAQLPDAPIIHEDLGTNVALHRKLKYGDLDKGFAEAEITLEDKFYFPKYTSSPLETYAVISSYDDATGILSVLCNFQGPWTMYSLMAKALRLPTDRVRLNVPKDIGGGFGIKSSLYPQITLVSLAAMQFGVPVKWIEDRREHLLSGSSGADRVAYVKIGANANGELTAMSLKFMDGMGGYIRAPEPGNLFRPLGNLVGPYRVQNVEMDAYAVLINKSPTGPNRGYGCQHLYFCIERMMDMLAAKLNIGVEEVRMRNLIQPNQFPYTTPTGGIYDSGDYPRTFTKVLDLVGYDALRQKQREWKGSGRYIGVGVALGVDPSVSNMGYVTIAYDAETRSKPDYLPKSGGSHIVSIKVEPFGKIMVKVDSNPQGQGHETVLTQIVADELGVRPEDISVNADFSVSENAWSVSAGTYASRFAAVGTSAAALAARKLKKKILEIAAIMLKAAPSDLEAANSYVFVKSEPERKISFRHVAGLAHWNPAALPDDMEPGLFSTSQYNIKTLTPPDQNDRVNSSGTYGFVADVAVVEIDPETGKIRILDYATVHDAGTIINPMIVDGQIHGSLLHGLAGALYEELAYNNDGQLLASTFVDYLAPTSMETISPKIGHIESPSPFTILGSKGVAESSSETAPVAIANAVADALSSLGIKITELPLSPEKTWKLLHSP